MRRMVALILAAAILPACNIGSRSGVTVTVNNTGAEAVRVRVEAQISSAPDDEHETIVNPGSNAFFSFNNVDRITVEVWRTSDGVKIFDEFWNTDDIRREHDSIDVTVSP